jgi:hypothetical protein
MVRFCHAFFPLSVTGKQRFECSGRVDVFGPFVPDTGAGKSGIQFASSAPVAESLAAASSSLRYSVERPIFNRRATSDICPR